MDFIFDPSLVIYLPLYELDGTTFKSRDAYGHLCTATGALWRHDGRSFDGDDSINCGDVTSGVSEFLVSFWFKLDSKFEAGVGYSLTLLRKAPGTSNYLQVWLSPGTGSMYVEKRTAGVNDYQMRTVDRTTWEAGVWFNIATYFGSSEQAILINGEVSVSDTQTSGTMPSGGDLVVGNSSPVGTDGHQGHIGEVLAYSRTLPLVNISHLYLATKWRYR